jgi:hypothetical protein
MSKIIIKKSIAYYSRYLSLKELVRDYKKVKK